MPGTMSKWTTQSIRGLKGKRPIVCVTAYDAVTAVLADEAEVDLILVGDSVGTTMLGFETTVPVTVDMMVHHTAAVARARPAALLVADVPFAAGCHEFDRVLDTCARLMREGGAEAVKIEGGEAMAPVVARLVRAGIPVLGHIGLLPQRYYALGGYRRFGRTPAEREHLLADVRALQDAGAFAIVAEMLDSGCAAALTGELEVPMIGIGCGPDCDGQILVCNDLLGYSVKKVPGFVKQYGDLAGEARKGFAAYARDVREKKFPSAGKSV